MRISLRFSFRALPAFKMKGTPSQRSFLMFRTIIANVGARESAATLGLSLYPSLPSCATYCPATTLCSTSTLSTCLSTFSFASLMSSGSKLTGLSMASTARTWSRWFWRTSRMMPCLSK